MPSRARTIKEFAREFFVRVSYVDIYGRNVGYDYDHILAEIKTHFPHAKTSKTWLRQMAYEIAGTVRMPTRRRSRRGLAEGYAMAQLLRLSQTTDRGLGYEPIIKLIRKKFPEQRILTSDLRRLENHLRFLKFVVPARS